MSSKRLRTPTKTKGNFDRNLKTRSTSPDKAPPVSQGWSVFPIIYVPGLRRPPISRPTCVSRLEKSRIRLPRGRAAFTCEPDPDHDNAKSAAVMAFPAWSRSRRAKVPLRRGERFNLWAHRPRRISSYYLQEAREMKYVHAPSTSHPSQGCLLGGLRAGRQKRAGSSCRTGKGCWIDLNTTRPVQEHQVPVYHQATSMRVIVPKEVGNSRTVGYNKVVNWPIGQLGNWCSTGYRLDRSGLFTGVRHPRGFAKLYESGGNGTQWQLWTCRETPQEKAMAQPRSD